MITKNGGYHYHQKNTQKNNYWKKNEKKEKELKEITIFFI